ncbi:hypothetical protein C461_03018 [Halorubrum aidingense JCM 13560]|uniref:Peptide ABC transporter ATP-binding protein n=1 Tax=Halorubrum aidingense JCM 13560 TaxID=1230454 RepID=M0PHA6_9EURY|nr:hypothetical protein [Halorubrum aidingense]EMA69298.1 hypothetical protein C461_03018 [Halorubrum aidingense JCM 13560]
MNRTEGKPPLSVETDDLTLAVDGVSLDVHSTGERLFVEADSVRDAIRTLRRVPVDDVRGPAAFLTATDLTTEFRVRGRTVAVIGAGARPGVLSRRLGVAPAEIRIIGVVDAAASGLASMRGAGRRLFQ